MRKGLSLMFLVWMILLVHRADPGRTTSENANGSLTTTACSGSDNCLIRGGDMDDFAEFQMNSHLARLLSEFDPPVTEPTKKKDKPSVNCPPDMQYTKCLRPPNGKSTKQPCGMFTRVC